LLPATDLLALRLTAGDLSLPPCLFLGLLPLKLREDFSLAGLELSDHVLGQLLPARNADLVPHHNNAVFLNEFRDRHFGSPPFAFIITRYWHTGNKKWRYEQTFLFHRVNRRTAMIRPASSRIADSGPVSGETRSARPVAAIRTREETIYWTPACGAGRSSISPYRVLTTGTPAMVPTGSAVAVTRATTPEGGIRRSLPSSRRTTFSCGVRFTMAVLHTWASPSSYIPRPPS